MKTTRTLLAAAITFLSAVTPTASPQPPATPTTLHRFAAPLRAGMGPMVEAPDGTLFGIAESGGVGDHGAVFTLTPDGSGGFTFSILHQFNGIDGAKPVGLTYSAFDDTLYGTTQGGGVNGPIYDGNGTVFSLTRAGILTTLIDFNLNFSNPQPLAPSAPLLEASDGNFYGTGTGASTTPGSGAIFTMDREGTYSVLHIFSGTDGNSPASKLVEGSDGLLYGTTVFGGSNDAGTVFRIAKDGSAFATLHNFTGDPGAVQPRGLFRETAGGADVFYGLTGGGGTDGRGSVFRITPSGTFTSVASFPVDGGGNALEGAYPNGALVKGPDGLFYGTTESGGPMGFASLGVVFSLDPAAGTIAVVHDFNSNYATGIQTNAGLLLAADGTLLGTTVNGGTHRVGTIYRVDTAVAPALVSKVLDIPSLGPAFPSERMLRASDGHLYGTTSMGGAFNSGSIFRLAGGVVTTLHSFNFADGHIPSGELMEGSDGNIYGTTTYGGNVQFSGDFGGGTVFRISKGGAFTTVHAFSNYGVEGAYPLAGLVEGPDGNFYGTTHQNGPSGAGTVFKMTPAGDTTTLHSFGVWSATRGTLVIGEDGYFYGATREGGTNPNGGTLYKIDSNGNFVQLYEFTNPADGAHPNGLMLGTDGNLYGTAEHGGTFYGTLFRLSQSGVFTLLHTFDTRVDGSNPTAVPFEAGDADLYGQTWFGGPLPGVPFTGLGTLYRYDSAAVQHLHTFDQRTLEPGSPYAGLMQGSDNLLYGMTQNLPGGAIYSFDQGITNKAPTARHQRVSVGPGESAAVNLVASDPDGDPLTFSIVGQPANGSVSGSGPAFLYEPNPGFSGADFFYVRVNDGTVSSPVAGVMITVGTSNTAPVANDQSIVLDEDTSTPITLTGSDPEGSALSFTVVTQPAHGVLSGTAPNLTYTPAPDYNGTDSFTFRVNDGTVDSNVATVTISVRPPNRPPVSNPGGPYVGNLGAAVTFDGTASSDPDAPFGDSIAIYSWTIAGSIALSGPTPTLSSAQVASLGSGVFPVQLTVTDEFGLTGTASTTLTVPPSTIATTTALQASATSVGALESVRLTAIVSPVAPGTGVPGGDVEFVLNGTTVLGVGSLQGGVASLTTNGGVSPGTYSITARYVGGAPFTASVSAPVSLTVRPLAQSTFTLLIPWTNPRALGMPVAVSAVVVPLAGGATPTGTVEFFTGAAPLGTATISGGLATLVWTPPTAGPLTIQARYLGDASFAASTSQPAMITIYTGAVPAATTTTLAITPSPATFGQPVTFTATVTGTVAPGGVVTFFADGSVLRSETVNNVGGVLQATFTTSALPLGVRIVSASYEGSPGFAASNAAPVALVINP